MEQERARPARRAKYQANGGLAGYPARRTGDARLRRGERLLGHRLPASAWSGGGWWRAANRHDLWHAPGWRLEAVDHRRASVTFVRVDPASEPAP
jgi:hypothetical protein